MKSKVTVAKDEAFIETRTRVIERFFTLLFNHKDYDPEQSKEVQEFLSEGKEFEARKQIEKGGGGGVFGRSLALFKNYFSFSKENKYSEQEQRIAKLRATLEELYLRAHELAQLLAEERAENARLQEQEGLRHYLITFLQRLQQHDNAQQANLGALQAVEFSLFCEN